jgi:hypothetical protein
VEDDTLLTIAFRFGVTVDEIMAVNPGIDPRILSIGTTLIIPLGEDGEAVIPTATPVPLLVGAVSCYPTALSGLWCFLPVMNELPFAVEGVTGEISIYDSSGELFASQRALPPVDVIPPEKRLPLYTSFSTPIPEGYFVRGSVYGAFLAQDGDDPQPLNLIDVSTEMSDSGQVVQVQGKVDIGEQETGDKTIVGIALIAAVAYDASNEVVGLRVWEQAIEADQGDRPPFSIQVYSLGPPIEEVEVFVEWRADLPVE